MHSKMVGLDSPPLILFLLSFYHLWQVQLLFRRSFARVLYPSHCQCLHSEKQDICHFTSAMTGVKRALPAKSFNGSTSHAFLALSAANQIQSIKASTYSSLHKSKEVDCICSPCPGPYCVKMRKNEIHFNDLY